MKNKFKVDGILLCTFICATLYSSTYPYIYKLVISAVSDRMLAANQIIECLSVVFFGELWKRNKNLFRYYPTFCVIETIMSIGLAVYTVVTHNMVGYYILNTLIYAIFTRNIICGGIKLKAIRYSSEEQRERFDNNNNSVSSVATILGSLIAMVLNLSFSAMIIIAILGNTIDNIFYICIYRKETKVGTESRTD